MHDGPAESAAELVENVMRLGLRQRREEISGVERLVAQKLVRAPPELVRARLDRDVHHAAGIPAEFGGIEAGLHLELLHGVDRRLDRHRGVQAVVVVDAVNEIRVAGIPRAVDEKRRPRPRIVGTVAAPDRPRRSKIRARHEDGQLGEVPLVQRKIQHVPLGHHVAQGGRFRFHQRDLLLHDHLLGDRAHLQREINSRGLVHLQLDPFADGLLEALLLGGERVSAEV